MLSHLQLWIKEKQALGEWNKSSVLMASQWAEYFTRFIDNHYQIRYTKQVRQQHLQLYRQQKLSTLAINSQHIEHKYINGFFKWCIAKGLLLCSPVPHWKLPPPPKQVSRYLSIDQIQTVFNAIDTSTARGMRNRAILELFYATGIRRAELGALNLNDLDLATGRLWIQHGKGNKQRMLSIIPCARNWLERYLQQARPHFNHNQHCQALFLGENGERLALPVIDHMFIHLRKITKVSPLSPHVLRHSCATHLMAAGVSLPYIQRFLGHSRIETTQRYLHLSISELQRNYDLAHPRDKWDLPS